MRDVELRRYAMLQRVFSFGARHRKTFVPGSVGHGLFQALDAHLAAIRDAAVAQGHRRGDSRGGTALKTETRRALLEQLDAIKDAVRAATGRRHVSTAFAKLRRPRDGELAAIARSIADDVAPNEAVLIAHHLSPTFLADLHAATDAFECALATRVEARARQTTSKTDLREVLIAAGEIARRLDAVVPNAFRRQHVAMTLWTRARRVEKKRGRRKQRKRRPPES